MEIWRQFAMMMVHVKRRKDGNGGEEVEVKEESGERRREGRDEGGEEGWRKAEMNEMIEQEIEILADEINNEEGEREEEQQKMRTKTKVKIEKEI
jgi:hypothetical protein